MVHFGMNCKSNLAHVWYTFVNFGTLYYNMVFLLYHMAYFGTF